MQMTLEGKVLIVIPCYNEEVTISKVTSALAQYFPVYDRLVIDDGSTDRSADIASEGAHVVRLPVNLGIGGAVQTGFIYAKENQYDFCIQVDGDGQHPVDAVRAIITKYLSSPHNITIGSRYIETGGGFQSTFLRRIGIRIIRFVVLLVTGVQITDPTSGLRLIDRSAIDVFAKEYPVDFPEPISIAIAFEAGLSMQEARVAMEKRFAGSSSISGIRSLSYMIRVCAYLFSVRLKRIF